MLPALGLDECPGLASACFGYDRSGFPVYCHALVANWLVTPAPVRLPRCTGFSSMHTRHPQASTPPVLGLRTDDRVGRQMEGVQLLLLRLGFKEVEERRPKPNAEGQETSGVPLDRILRDFLGYRVHHVRRNGGCSTGYGLLIPENLRATRQPTNAYSSIGSS